jgi:hypothetical protein
MPGSDRAIQGSLNRIPARLSNIPSPPMWVRAVVVLGALLMATGAVLAFFRPEMLVSPHYEINGAVRIYAGYLTSRNLTIALMLLNSLILLTGFVQALDAVVDMAEGRWVIVPGVAVLALLFFLAAARLSGYPFWRVGAWRLCDAAAE